MRRWEVVTVPDTKDRVRVLLESDPQLNEAILAATSREDVVRLLTDAGVDVGHDDLWPPHPDDELSDSELLAAGGMTYPSFACPLPETMVWPLGPC